MISAVLVIIVGLTVLLLIWSINEFQNESFEFSREESDEIRRMIDEAHG